MTQRDSRDQMCPNFQSVSVISASAVSLRSRSCWLAQGCHWDPKGAGKWMEDVQGWRQRNLLKVSYREIQRQNNLS